MTGRFNAREAWAALDDEQRRAIGEAALLLHISAEALELYDDYGETGNVSADEVIAADRRWERAEQIAWRALTDAVPIDADDFHLAGPDLAALDIRACRVCGCTDDHACAGGCSSVLWIKGSKPCL